MTGKQKLIAVALVVVVFPLLLWAALQPSKNWRNVDAVITIDTAKPIHLIDTDGRDVGSIEFDGELTVMIRRLKR
jgi:cytochrome oxidase Cu insertion factor (SCO1/SenC/PrrC family)